MSRNSFKRAPRCSFLLEGGPWSGEDILLPVDGATAHIVCITPASKFRTTMLWRGRYVRVSRDDGLLQWEPSGEPLSGFIHRTMQSDDSVLKRQLLQLLNDDEQLAAMMKNHFFRTAAPAASAHLHPGENHDDRQDNQ